MLREVSIRILSAILLFCLSIGIIGFSAVVLLEPATYHDALSQTQAYNEIQELVEPSGIELTAEDQRILIRETILYMQGKGPQPDLTFEVGFTDTQVREFIAEMEVCVPDTPSDGFCKPAGVDDKLLFAQARAELPPPVEIDLWESETLPIDSVEEFRSNVQLGIIAVQASVIVGIICVLLILFLMRDDIRKGIRFIDGDLIIAGGSAAVTAYFLLTYLPTMLQSQMQATQTVTQTLNALYIILSSVLGAMLAYGIGAVGIGLGTLFLTLFGKKHKRAQE